MATTAAVTQQQAPASQNGRMQQAFELWMHGDSDGKRITSLTRLSQITGLHLSSISKAKKRCKWDAKRASILAHSNPLAIAHDPNTLDEIQVGADMLAAEKRRLEAEIKAAAPQSDLYSKLIRDYDAVCKRWERFSGAAGLIEAGISRAKEEGKRAGKGAEVKTKGFLEVRVDPPAAPEVEV